MRQDTACRARSGCQRLLAVPGSVSHLPRGKALARRTALSALCVVTWLWVVSSPAAILAQSGGPHALPADGPWADTGPNYSLEPAPRLFERTVSDGALTIATDSAEDDFHSHLTSTEGLGALRLTGELRANHRRGRTGVTLLSSFPHSDRYYRLKSTHNSGFVLDARGTGLSGNPATGVPADPNTWYSFVVEVEVLATETVVRARVWPSNTADPSAWQVECVDASQTRAMHGSVGIWSKGRGARLWRGLAVETLGPRYPEVLVNDFESDPGDLDGEVFRHVVAAQSAHGGEGSVAIKLDASVPIADRVPSSIARMVIPFLITSDTIHARWYFRWNEPIALEASGVTMALEQYLSDNPGLLDTASETRLRTLVTVLPGLASTIPTLEGGIWHCFGAAYAIGQNDDPDLLEIFIDGQLAASVEGLSLLTDAAVIDAFLEVVRRSMLVQTEATRAFVDDLMISNVPIPACQ